MKTFFYNIETGEKGEFRDGPYMVDGQPGVLPPHLVEITLIEKRFPDYDTRTQITERIETLDLNKKEFIIDYIVRDLTRQEIEEREDSEFTVCTPKQFRLAMIEFGIDPDFVTNMLQSIPDEMERKIAIITWEYAVYIEKNHPLILQFANVLGVDRVQLNNIFKRAQDF
jgi:hypothetical protein